MNTLAGLVEFLDGREELAVGLPELGTNVYTADQLASTTRSLMTVLADAGVTTDSLVAVTPAPAPETVIGVFAAASLGATVRVIGPSRAPVAAVLGPTAEAERYETPPDALTVGFGARPDSDSTVRFERAVYRAEPHTTESPVVPSTTALSDGNTTFTHHMLLEAAQTVANETPLTAGTKLAVRAPLTDPRTITGGILAPLAVRGSVLFPPDDQVYGDLALTDENAPESRVQFLFDVPLEGEY